MTWMRLSSPAQPPHYSFVVASGLQLINLSLVLFVCKPTVDTCIWNNPHHFNRTPLCWESCSLMALFNLYESCRWLYWDHAWSLDFGNIMLTSSLTPTKELAWLQLFFGSAYTFQLEVVCSRETFAVITHHTSVLGSFRELRSIFWSFIHRTILYRPSSWFGRVFRSSAQVNYHVWNLLTWLDLCSWGS